MANNTANIDPRYLTYNKDEVQRILNGVEHVDATPTADSNYPVKSGGVAAAIAQIITSMTEALEQYITTKQLAVLLDAKQDATPTATEQDIRAIVTDYTTDASSSSSDSSSSDSSSSDSSSSDSSSSDSGA